MARSRTHALLFAIALGSAAGDCSHPPPAPSAPSTVRSEALPMLRDAGVPHDPVPPSRPDLPRLDGMRCPLAFEDADVILARVNDTVITACDVAIDSARALREGLAPRSPHDALRALVADALLAAEARAQGLDREPATVRRMRETLASGLVRAESIANGDVVPDDAQIERYYDAHRDEFTLPERVHLRAVALANEASAHATLRDALAGAPFDALVRERTVSPEGRRDEGDLGLVPRGGNDRVPRVLADAGFAIAEVGGFYPEPVRVETTLRVGRRRRPRRVVTYYVVQLLGRLPAEPVPLAEAARRIRWALARQRYQSTREAVRARLLEQARREVPVELDVASLRLVRIRPAVLPARRRSVAARPPP